MLQGFSDYSGKRYQVQIFRNIFSGKASSTWFATRKTALSIQMESAPETSRYKVCPYRNPFPSSPRLFSFTIGSSHLLSTILQYQTTILWFRMI